ncbi:MAG TPA: response regulator [Candidatus Dormibacteraeota bacterium]|nr:response regulator [Candidatus Dormibacteraeota bacterium]
MAEGRILVVDDEPQVRKLLETYLGRSGFTVRTAVDGLDALEQLREEVPDLIITDVTMPNLNGLELTRRLRTSHKTARVPILMLSALKQEHDVLEGYAQGADDYVGKPVELTILRAKIDLLLRRSQLSQPAVGGAVGEVIGFLHGKGGVGATTLAVNTALAMMVRSPDRVGLLDLNTTFSDSPLLLDLRSLHPLTRLAELHGDIDDETFDRFVTVHSSGVRVVVANIVPEEAEWVSVPAAQLAIDRLRKRSDYVVVDLPANFTEQTLAAIDVARLLCIVTTNHLPSMKGARDCLSVLTKINFAPEKVRIVLNQATPGGLTVEQVGSFFRRPPDAVVGYSELFDPAADAGRPVILGNPSSSAASDIRKLAQMIDSSLGI